MAYNEQLAEKVRQALSHLKNVQEKKMFRGITFMLHDKMCISVRTVEGYREKIFEKTGSKTLAGITIFAIKNGYHEI